MLPGARFGYEWRFDPDTVRAKTFGSGASIKLIVRPNQKGGT
jgi:hypothetical protein